MELFAITLLILVAATAIRGLVLARVFAEASRRNLDRRPRQLKKASRSRAEARNAGARNAGARKPLSGTGSSG